MMQNPQVQFLFSDYHSILYRETLFYLLLYLLIDCLVLILPKKAWLCFGLCYTDAGFLLWFLSSPLECSVDLFHFGRLMSVSFRVEISLLFCISLHPIPALNKTLQPWLSFCFQSVAELAEDIWDRYGHNFGTDYSGLFTALTNVNYNVRLASAEALAAALDENPETIQVGLSWFYLYDFMTDTYDGRLWSLLALNFIKYVIMISLIHFQESLSTLFSLYIRESRLNGDSTDSGWLSRQGIALALHSAADVLRTKDLPVIMTFLISRALVRSLLYSLFRFHHWRFSKKHS